MDDQPTDTDRRSMLRAVGSTFALAAAGATSLLRAGPAGAAAEAKPRTRPTDAMRWMQIAFTEDDPGRWDLQFWLDYFRESQADAVCVSAGGSIAFYPSQVPWHHRAMDLGDRDVFGDMVRGCRGLGMSVIARLDPHALSAEAMAAHPEWVARTAGGEPVRHWAAPDLYVACANGPFMTDFMPAVIAEIAGRYDIDAFFGNRWGGSVVCHCASCKDQFRAATGFDVPTSLVGFMEMPPAGGPEESACLAYIHWHNGMRFTQSELWTKAAAAVRPELYFVGGPMPGLELDPNRLAPLVPVAFVDRQGRTGVAPPWNNGRWAKQYRGFMGSKPIVGIFSIGLEEPYRWKDSVQSGAEISAWLADGVAQGFRPWLTKFNAKPFDTRWMPVVRQRYQWLARNERYLRNTGNLARVAIVHSPETVTFVGRGARRRNFEDALSGYYHALVEARVPFEMLDARQLDPAHTARFRVLVLPDIAALSDAQCAQLQDFVREGGRIVATHETSLYDLEGKRRANFGLSDLFGCDFAGTVEERVQNSYLALHPPHALVRGLEGTPRVIGAVARVRVTPTDAGAQPVTLVPSYPDLPMERVFPPANAAGTPMVFCRSVGRGRVVYFPMDLDRTFWEVLSPDHGTLLANAVQWAADEPPPVVVSGAGVMDISVWRQAGSLTVHIVNLNNPMMMKGPFREIIPSGPVSVSLALPAGARIRAVHLLEGGRRVAHALRDGAVRVELPSVALHEIIAYDLA